jgi:CelD/BcsL family acetyltransferase involved in cellulose biosynthesis
MSTIDTTVLESRETFFSLEQDWKELYQLEKDTGIFMSWEWISKWAKYFAGENDLFTVVARDAQGKILGVLPLYKKHRRLFGRDYFYDWYLLGTDSPACSEQLRILCAKENEENILEKLVSTAIARIGRFDSLVLPDLKPSTLDIAQYDKVGRENGLEMREQEGETCYAVTLPGDWEEFLQELSSRFRKDVRQSLKNLHKKLGSRVVQETGQERVTSVLERLFEISTDRLGEIGIQSNLGRQVMSEFLKEVVPAMVENGQAWMHTISDGDDIAGVAISFLSNKKVWVYQQSFDPKYGAHKLGIVLIATIAKQAIENGSEVLDLLRGEYRWKYRWGAKPLNTTTLEYINPNSYAIISRNIYKQGARVYRKLKTMLPVKEASW